MARRAFVTAVVVIAMSGMWAMPPSMAGSSRVKAAGSGSKGWRWDPSSRTISKGDRIVWTNPTGKRHTVTAYGGTWTKSTTLDSGERTAKRFRRRGTYRYRCMVSGHSAINDGRCVGMCGQIVVR